MHLQKLSEKLFAQLEEQIRETDSISNPVEQLKTGLTHVQTALARSHAGHPSVLSRSDPFGNRIFMNCRLWHRSMILFF
jgi:hypothetical protein